MARYYGGYGYPVQQALRDTAGILGEGISDIGKGRLRAEELGLRRTLQERQLARENVADTRAAETYALGKPGLQLSSEKSTAELAKLNSPVSVASIFPDAQSLTHGVYVPAGETMSLAEKIGGIFGAKVDVTPESPTYGKYLKADGTPLLQKDLRTRAQDVANVMMANTNPLHIFNDQLSRQQEKLQSIMQKDPELKSPEAQGLVKNMKNTMAWLENPSLQLSTLQKQRDYLGRLEGPEFEKATARLDKQIDTIKASITKHAETADTRAWEREKLGIEEKGKKERSEEHDKALKEIADTRADASTVGKTPKLDPASQAELDSMKTDLKSNLDTIRTLKIEKFRAIDPQGRKEIESEISSIKKENETIKKKIANFGKPQEEQPEPTAEPKPKSWRDYQSGPSYRGKIER